MGDGSSHLAAVGDEYKREFQSTSNQHTLKSWTKQRESAMCIIKGTLIITATNSE
jgi:hypothetical protein